jgi:hypothetical protein
MIPHKEIPVILKFGEVLVDENIVPLILWMNKFKSVETDYSCEGNNGIGAYVSFHSDIEDIIEITKKLNIWYYTDDHVIMTVGFNPQKHANGEYVSLSLKYAIRVKTESGFLSLLNFVRKDNGELQ